VGELSLSGDVRPVGGLPRRLAEAARLGFRTALVPAGAEVGRTKDLRIVTVANIGEAITAVHAIRG
jgi:DNA repair protein RadA/Sms